MLKAGTLKIGKTSGMRSEGPVLHITYLHNTFTQKDKMQRLAEKMIRGNIRKTKTSAPL